MTTRHTIAMLLSAVLGCAREQDAPPENDSGGDASATDSASASGSSSDGGGECVGPGDCYACEPSQNQNQNQQLLNHCTEAACEPFPNTPERLPLLLPDGSLPPLP
ncbi:MAG: hypothetical protein IPN32_04905 [Deltaproteobacteria bacterium]|nr:hypothetical protein [Deltaproteobacteria bacterium]